MNQPTRQYPLRELNEPAVYVAGDMQGQRVFLDQTQATQIPSVVTGRGHGTKPTPAPAASSATLAKLERERGKEVVTALVSWTPLLSQELHGR